MMLPLSLLVIIIVSLAASSVELGQVARKHWRRAPVHGAFNVDAYAYNKPVVNLAGQLPKALPGQALPMGRLLEQLSQSSRKLPMAQYRNLDRGESKQATDLRQGASLDAAALAALNSHLAKLQMNMSLGQEKVYSHEFHVQNKGNKKIVLINTLDRAKFDQTRKPDEKVEEVKAKPEQQSPFNVKLTLPVLVDSRELEVEQTTTPRQLNAIEIVMNTEAISSLKSEPTMEEDAEKRTKQQELIDDNKRRANDARNATTIEMESTAAAIARPGHEQQHLKKSVNAKQKMEGEEEQQQVKIQWKEKKEQQQQQEKMMLSQLEEAHQAQMSSKPGQSDDDDDVSAVDAAKKRDSQNDNDGPANGTIIAQPGPGIVPGAGAVAGVGPAVDKPLRLGNNRLKSNRKRTQTKTKKPNEIGTKPTTPSAPTRAPTIPATAVKLMTGSADVKAPTEISPQDIRRPMQKGSKLDGKGKRRGAQRRPTAGDEQEIETTTNWWHILPYAEIRKFLNTIYDSIAYEADDERAQRM